MKLLTFYLFYNFSPETISERSYISSIIVAISFILILFAAAVIIVSRLRVKKATRELKNVTEELKLALKAGNIEAWTFSFKEQKFYPLYGGALLDSMGSMKLEDFIRRIDERDVRPLRKILSMLENGEKDNASSMVTYRELKNPDKITYLKSEMRVLKNEYGKRVGILGTRVDINKDFLYQKQLEESIRKTELSIISAEMVMWEYDTISKKFSTINDPMNFYDSKINMVIDDYLAILHPEDYLTFTRCVEKMNEGNEEKFEMRVRFTYPQNKEYSLLKINGSPFERDKTGKAIKYVGFRKDITESFNRQKYLRESLNKISLVSQSNEIVFWDYDVLNKVFTTDFSPLTNGRMVMTPEEYLAYVHPEDISLAQSMIKILDRGDVGYYTTEFRFNEREVYKWNIVYVCCFERDEKDKVIKYTGLSRNNTEWKNLLHEQVELKEKAEASDKLKSKFLANMSHEIRTPLNAILGFSQLMIDCNDKEEREKYQKILLNNNDLLLKLIEDILDISEIESDIKMNLVNFDFAETFNSLGEELKGKYTNPEVKFMYKNPYKKCMVNLDIYRIQQIISNLVTNAMKFTKKGKIVMGYIAETDGLRINVSDTGIGIEKSKIDKIFDRFEKGDDFSQGTGLGLAITKAIVEAMGGKIRVYSTLGKGSTFSVFIPCNMTVEYP